MPKKRLDPIREAKRAARAIIGEPSRNRKRGPHRDEKKEANRNECRTLMDTKGEVKFLDEMPDPEPQPAGSRVDEGGMD